MMIMIMAIKYMNDDDNLRYEYESDIIMLMWITPHESSPLQSTNEPFSIELAL